MKTILRSEELVMFLLGIFAFSRMEFAWWWFPALFFVPDIGMTGYLFGNKTGAACSNVFHHKGVAILVFLTGIWLQNPILQLIGVILFAHSAFDRMLGYGLKYESGFKFTHLGEIGK